MSIFDELTWYRISCDLVNTRSVAHKVPPGFVPFQAIVKWVSAEVQQAFGHSTEPPAAFHLLGKSFRFKPTVGDRVTLEVLLFTCSAAQAQAWAEVLERYFADRGAEANWQPVGAARLEQRSYPALVGERGVQDVGDEVCLEFLMPVPLRVSGGRSRTYVDAAGLVSLFEGRFRRLFGREVRYAPGGDEFYVLPCYWKYTQVGHPSSSQAGTVQYIKGCVGSLYLRGRFANFLPFLVLGSEVHAGPKLSNAQGYYLLFDRPRPYFDRFFPDRLALTAVAESVAERYDDLTEALGAHGPEAMRPELLAADLWRDLREGRWEPAPSEAFVVRKPDGTERLLERFNFRDRVVYQYLLKVLEGPFDRLFEESSVGFRKGRSRQDAVALVQQALADGFQYIVESDIEEFFPSVDLSLLAALLDRYLPKGDVLLRSVLDRCLRAGYLLKGVFHERRQGLPQGSPLSPILANLYLDAFDEHVASLGVRLVRYADDFVILARSRSEALKVFAAAEEFLASLGLRTKSEKTGVRPVAEGFEFLGIKFTRSEAVVSPEEEIRRLRKPLYVTEPYLFVSLNGEAVDLVRARVPVQTFPLRRISEIILMENAVVSTALLRKCVQDNIPISITLGSGYYVTTVKPDSKRYYSLVFEHGRRYSQLSDTEVLAIAKDIAAAKVENTVQLFRQKYVAGANRLIRDLEDCVRRIHEAGDLDAVRGQEGAAARLGYRGLNLLLDDAAFHLTRRRRERPDRMNSLLNLGYYSLYGRINATVRSVGLNPYLGFLHAPEDSYESLVADLVEPFRARIDRFVVRLVNLRIVRSSDFTEGRNGAYLTREAKKRFIEQFEAELEKRSGKDGATLGQLLYYQIVVVKKWVVEGGSLTFYRWNV